MSDKSQSNRRQQYLQEHWEQTDALEQFNKMVIDLPWNVSTDATATKHKESLLIIKDIQEDIEKIPDYLTKHNLSFQEMIHRVQHSLLKTTTNNKKEIIRKIALVIYKIMIIQTYHLLWTTYLKSGLGQLIIMISSNNEQPLLYPTDIPIWPHDLKILLPITHATTKQNQNEVYSNFVHEQLYALDHQLKEYKNQLNVEANHIHGYTLIIQKIIETYIEQNLRLFRMKIEHQIELIHYDYHIQALKLEYLRHSPNQFQEKLLKEICHSKYEQETSEQEYHFLKYQMNYHINSPNQSFECSPLAQSTTTLLLDSIPNVNIRQQLFQQYKGIAEQARNDLFQVYMKSAEEKRQEYAKKYEENIEKMWSVYRHPINNNQTISRIMIQLIDQRCQKISEHVQCIYKFKTKSFGF